jgi:hypothetical protein
MVLKKMQEPFFTRLARCTAWVPFPHRAKARFAGDDNEF